MTANILSLTVLDEKTFSLITDWSDLPGETEPADEVIIEMLERETGENIESIEFVDAGESTEGCESVYRWTQA